MTTWQQYELVCTIGQGKYGTVARARHKKLGSLVALKSVFDMQTELAISASQLSSSSNSRHGSSSTGIASSSNHLNGTNLSGDEISNGGCSLSKERRSLYHEARVLATLSHPCLVSLVEICVDSRGELVLAMEDLGGMTLSVLVRQRKHQHEGQERQGCGEGLCDCLVGCVVSHVACGLRYLHSRGYLHRDVKPDNIMVENTSHHCFPHAKLIDLGLSIAYSEKNLPNTSNSRAGTLAFMAPELMLPNTVYGPKVDLFSLGACLYFALVGEEPFTAFTTKNGIRSTTSIFGLQFQHEDGMDSLRPEVKEIVVASLYTSSNNRCSVQQLLRTPWLQTCAVAGSFIRHAGTALPELASRLQLQHDIPSTLFQCLHSDCASVCSRLNSNISSSLAISGGLSSSEEADSIRDSCEFSDNEHCSSDSLFTLEDCSNVLPAWPRVEYDEKVPAVASLPLTPNAPSVNRDDSINFTAARPPSSTDIKSRNNRQSITKSCSINSSNSSKSFTTNLDPISGCVSVPSSSGSTSSESLCRVLGLKDAVCRSLSPTSSCSCPDGSSNAVPRETDTVAAVARLLEQDTDTVLRSLECQPWGETAGMYNLLKMEEKQYIRFSPPVTDQEVVSCGVEDAVIEGGYCSDASKMMNKTL